NDVRVLPHDPLFLMTSTRFHEIPEKTSAKVPNFPASLKFPKSIADRIFYDARSKMLTYKGSMTEQHKAVLLSLAEQDSFTAAVEELFAREPSEEEAQATVKAYREAVEDMDERSNPDPVATVLHAESFEWPVPNKLGQTSTVE